MVLRCAATLLEFDFLFSVFYQLWYLLHVSADWRLIPSPLSGSLVVLTVIESSVALFLGEVCLDIAGLEQWSGISAELSHLTEEDRAIWPEGLKKG